MYTVYGRNDKALILGLNLRLYIILHILYRLFAYIIILYYICIGIKNKINNNCSPHPFEDTGHNIK